MNRNEPISDPRVAARNLFLIIIQSRASIVSRDIDNLGTYVRNQARVMNKIFTVIDLVAGTK